MSLPLGTTLEVRRNAGPFRKGERWVITNVVGPRLLVSVECPGRALVELFEPQLARLLADGAMVPERRAEALPEALSPAQGKLAL